METSFFNFQQSVIMLLLLCVVMPRSTVLNREKLLVLYTYGVVSVYVCVYMTLICVCVFSVCNSVYRI